MSARPLIHEDDRYLQRNAPRWCRNGKVNNMKHRLAAGAIAQRATSILSMGSIFVIILSSLVAQSSGLPQLGYHNGFQLYSPSVAEPLPVSPLTINQSNPTSKQQQQQVVSPPELPIGNHSIQSGQSCTNGLLTFELSTGFIYKPSSVETLAMMPSTLQLTDCLDYCLQNASCLAINFEMGLCVLLSSSAKQNPTNLYSSQFPVFTIYAEKKCLLSGDPQAIKQRRRCQRAWTFERVAGYEMKTRPRKRLKLATKEHCMEACLLERDFECRSANWYRQTGECTLSDQDRHSVSQSEAGDQQVKLHDLYGPSNLTLPGSSGGIRARPTMVSMSDALPGSLYQNYYMAGPPERSRNLTSNSSAVWPDAASILRDGRRMGGEQAGSSSAASNKYRQIRQLEKEIHRLRLMPAANLPLASGGRLMSLAGNALTRDSESQLDVLGRQDWLALQYADMPANALVDYLENNCIYEPNKLCEFRKIQNRVLKTVDSIYQDVMSLDECKQKCLNAPYRCYSFDYGDTSERVCRTSHLDQASLLSVKEPYLDVVGAITYELASCFNVSIQCRAREMVAQVSSSKTFKGKIYVKSRPSTCVNDVRESLQFELTMGYHDENCDVRASSNSKQGVFSNDIVIQHHDRIITTQDVGLSVYCQYDLGNKSITNNVDLAIERLDESIESKTRPHGDSALQQQPSPISRPGAGESGSGGHSLLTITSLATTVVRSPNVTMRITNMNGQPVTSATVGDRLALLFEIKEKSSPFGIYVREIIAMDGLQLLQQQQQQQFLANNKANNGSRSPGKGPLYHYAASNLTAISLPTGALFSENSLDSFQPNKANSIQFIDAMGCPTDSNIMGPLVRMDPAGHRILAPFDAFKFPTSDMVFFRAVVSSCISDCKPVICAGQNEAAPVTFSPSAPGESLSLAGSEQHLPASTSRNMPTRSPNPPSTYEPPEATGTNQASAGSLRLTSAAAPLAGAVEQELTRRPQMPASTKTTGQFEYVTTLATHLVGPSELALPQWPTPVDLPDLTAPRDRNKLAQANGNGAPATPATSELGPGSFSSVASDSLTTVPGFGSQEAATLENHIAGSSPAGGNLQQQQPPVALNMTNNHHGKPAPRPTMASQQAISDKVPLDLDNMSVQQKRQLVQLFESKLKQQLDTPANNGSGLAEMADLYTGFLTSVKLNGFAQNGSSGFNDDEDGLDGSQDTYKRQEVKPGQAMVARLSGSDEANLAQVAATNMVDDVDANWSNLAMHLAELGDRFVIYLSKEARLGQNAAGDKLTTILVNNLKRLKQRFPKPSQLEQDVVLNKSVLSGPTELSASSRAWFSENQSANSDSPGNGSNLNGSLNIATGDQAATQQTFDRPNLVSDPPLASSNRSTGILKHQTRSHQQQMAAGSGNRTGIGLNKLANKAAQPLQQLQLQQQQQVRRKTRDKSQEYADSYLGAFQTSVTKPKQHRRRREAQSQEADLTKEHDKLLSSGYVYLEQPQWSAVAPSEANHEQHQSGGQHMRFTRAIVQMYHRPVTGQRSIDRFKREAQPFYDVDELIVQSIKIVDRLDADESRRRAVLDGAASSGRPSTLLNKVPNNKLADASNRHSLPRSLLVTNSAGNWPRNGSMSALHRPPGEVGHRPSPLRASQDNGDQSASRSRSTSWTGAGALSLLIVALSLIFLQLFLVLVCLLDWGRSKGFAQSAFHSGVNSGASTGEAAQQVLVDHYVYGLPGTPTSSLCSPSSPDVWTKTLGSMDLSLDRKSAYSNYHQHNAHLQHSYQHYLEPMFAIGRPHPVAKEPFSVHMRDKSTIDSERALEKIGCIACLLPNQSNNLHNHQH